MYFPVYSWAFFSCLVICAVAVFYLALVLVVCFQSWRINCFMVTLFRLDPNCAPGAALMFFKVSPVPGLTDTLLGKTMGCRGYPAMTKSPVWRSGET